MKTILVIPPYFPLIATEDENIDKEPNNDLPKPLLLMPYFPFSLKSFSFLFLDFEIMHSKKPKTLDSCLELIMKQKPKKIVFDFLQEQQFEKYNQNLQNIIEKIKTLYPEIKIEELKNNKEGNFEEKNLEKIKEIRKYAVRNEQKLFVIQDLANLKDVYKILNQEIYDFWFFNFRSHSLKEILKLKKDYFDLNYYLTCDFEKLNCQDARLLSENGLEKLYLKLKINNKSFDCFSEHLEKLKNISSFCKIELTIIPEISEIKNIELIDFLNTLDLEKIKYTIKQTTRKIETKTEFINFGVLALLNALEKKEELKKRLIEIPKIKDKTTFEQIISFIFKTEKKYLEFYIDIIHFLDGFFTKEEIIDYLNRLHPETKKENIEKIVYNFISLLEKEMFIDYVDSKKEQKSHYISALPRNNNLFYMYSCSQKGYILGKNQKLEEVPKDVFFFFVFSKGIFMLREIANKLRLLFKDKKEFSKDNYLKSTEKIYNTLKQYGLCK
ncbi:MAG TPA: hypothetical protein PK655_00080 [archaeon]|nr:hypothetical protein [archaeon]HPV65842.1 hypothetical protein [archaeon]